MHSPWLDIPLADYEGHMSLPSIGQAAMVATHFAELLAAFAPSSVAVIGCAGGNGFEHLRGEITKRVVGVDINPRYIEALSNRYITKVPGLELYTVDVQEARSLSLVKFIGQPVGYSGRSVNPPSWPILTF